MEADDNIDVEPCDTDEEYQMGEMLRTLSSDGCDRGASDGVPPVEDFDDLFEPLAGEDDDEEVDLFQRVGSNDGACADSGSDGCVATAPDDDEVGIDMFAEEAELLSAIYEGCKWNERRNCFTIQVVRGDTLELALTRRGVKSAGIVLNILRLRGYPHRAPEVSIEPWHNLLSADDVHLLYAAINANCKSLVGTPLLMAVVSTAAELCDAMIRDQGITQSVALQRIDDLKALGFHIRNHHETLSPTQYLGSVGDLISRLPKNVDVINVENVLRPDLASRFERTQRYFYQKYVAKLESKDATKHLRNQKHILQLADIRPAFHGTRMTNVGKIVRSGLLVPGSATGIRVSTGSRYGCGIYSSPDPELALCYAGSGYEDIASIKLMIVAVLMGKERIIPDGMEPWGGGCTEGFDSHTSQDGKQFVVFHEAQILPCYVLHLMVRKGGEQPVLSSLQLERSSHQRQTKSTAILTQMARKNLPFGFGPRGGHFVVEDIAECSDDEEEWGEFQMLRNGGGVGNEEYQHETLLPPPPPPLPKRGTRSLMQNPNR